MVSPNSIIFEKICTESPYSKHIKGKSIQDGLHDILLTRRRKIETRQVNECNSISKKNLKLDKQNILNLISTDNFETR